MKTGKSDYRYKLQIKLFQKTLDLQKCPQSTVCPILIYLIYSCLSQYIVLTQSIRNYLYHFVCKCTLNSANNTNAFLYLSWQIAHKLFTNSSQTGTRLQTTLRIALSHTLGLLYDPKDLLFPRFLCQPKQAETQWNKVFKNYDFKYKVAILKYFKGYGFLWQPSRNLNHFLLLLK